MKRLRRFLLTLLAPERVGWEVVMDRHAKGIPISTIMLGVMRADAYGKWPRESAGAWAALDKIAKEAEHEAGRH
jgi:hypothetical protein